MDPWIFAEIWWKDAKVVGSEPFNAGRFGLCCFFGAIVAGELLYLLINMAQHGRQFAFFNYLIPVLGCLIVQFITLAIAMWLAYVPLLEYYLTPVDFMLGLGMFSSFWVPLALAEVTSYLHFIMKPGTTGDGPQDFKIKKQVDNAFTTSCIIANVVRNALWVAYIEQSIAWDSVWAYQHFYFGVESMTILNIWSTAVQLNLEKYRNQEKVVLAIQRFLVPALFIRETFVFVHYLASSSSSYDEQWYEYRLGQATFQGLLEVFIVIALMYCARTIKQEVSHSSSRQDEDGEMEAGGGSPT